MANKPSVHQLGFSENCSISGAEQRCWNDRQKASNDAFVQIFGLIRAFPGATCVLPNISVGLVPYRRIFLGNAKITVNSFVHGIELLLRYECKRWPFHGRYQRTIRHSQLLDIIYKRVGST